MLTQILYIAYRSNNFDSPSKKDQSEGQLKTKTKKSIKAP